MHLFKISFSLWFRDTWSIYRIGKKTISFIPDYPTGILEVYPLMERKCLLWFSKAHFLSLESTDERKSKERKKSYYIMERSLKLEKVESFFRIPNMFLSKSYTTESLSVRGKQKPWKTLFWDVIYYLNQRNKKTGQHKNENWRASHESIYFSVIKKDTPFADIST